MRYSLHLWPAILLCLMLLLAGGCSSTEHPSEPLLTPFQAGELIVVTRESPTTHFVDSNGNATGFEFDLASMFASELGLRLRVEKVKTIGESYEAVRQGRAHINSSGLPAEALPIDLRPGPRYFSTQPVLVYNTDQNQPEDWPDVEGATIGVLQGSGIESLMQSLQQKHPTLTWESFAETDPEFLLQEVSLGNLRYAVVDRHVLAISRNIFLNIDQAFEVGPEHSLAWTFPADAPAELIAKADSFFTSIKNDGRLRRLIDRYYGHIKRMEVIDAAVFQDRVLSMLPAYRQVFEQAERETGIDWRLLAGVAYRESHWDPLATSPTGVRGMMMLTEETAATLGVTDRLNPRQSILAGARYLRQLRDALDADILEPDRTWMALAAYNIGPAHLADARTLARRLRLDPNAWTDVKKALPLLSRPEHYATLRAGFARGGAPVIFTEHVRALYDILARLEGPKRPSLRLVVANDCPSKPQRTMIGDTAALLPTSRLLNTVSARQRCRSGDGSDFRPNRQPVIAAKPATTLALNP